MTRAVFALGAVMALVGLLAISYGIPLVRLEIGWTAVIGGSVAAAAGCVVLVLGVFLLRLEQMQTSLDRLLPVATPEDLPAFRAPDPVQAEAEPFDLPAPVKPLHPLSPAARVREVEDDVAAAKPVWAAAEPPLELTSPFRPEPDWAEEPPAVEEPILAESAPALVHAEEEMSHPPTVEAPDPVDDALAETPVARPRPSFLASLLARRGTSEPRSSPSAERFARLREPAGPPLEMPSLRDLPVDLSSGWDEAGPHASTRRSEPETEAVIRQSESHPDFGHGPPREVSEAFAYSTPSEPSHEPAMGADAEPERPGPEFIASEPDAPPQPLPVPDPLQPIVVGRYNAGSASYVMFSNGMIQVETEQGTHEFASMQELKVFIERRDARAS